MKFDMSYFGLGVSFICLGVLLLLFLSPLVDFFEKLFGDDEIKK